MPARRRSQISLERRPLLEDHDAVGLGGGQQWPISSSVKVFMPVPFLRMIARSRSSRPRHLALTAAAGGPIVVDAHQLVRRILLRDNAVRVVVGVLVALRVAQRRRTGVVPVAQMGAAPDRPCPP